MAKRKHIRISKAKRTYKAQREPILLGESIRQLSMELISKSLNQATH